jgi:hypothetical protein
MPAPVYSLRIFATGGLVPASGVVGPIVPAGLVYVLRDIDLVELSGSTSAGFQLYGQTGNIIWVVQHSSAPGITQGQWRGRQVYNEGEQVGFQSATGTWSISASGYQLSLP